MAKGGLFNKLMFGKEKSEDYARNSLPSNRWQLFWDIFKSRFGSLIIINLLTLLFFIPLILLIYVRFAAGSVYGSSIPYSAPLGIGYQALLSFQGSTEAMNFNLNLTILVFLPVAGAIASIGLSGGAYIIRNLIWTEGVFVVNDFWHGIKQNFKDLLFLTLLYTTLLYGLIVGISLAERAIALGEAVTWIMYICKYAGIICVVVLTVMYLHSIPMAVTYKMPFVHLIRNSFYLTFSGLIPHNIVFGALSLLPVAFFLVGGFMIILGIIIGILCGLSFTMLVWTDYAQWVYDKFINPKIPGAKKNRGIYEKVSTNESKSIKKYREQLEVMGTTYLGTRPIKPITDEEIKLEELPEGYTRADIERLNKSREEMYADNERYIEAHKAEFPEDKKDEKTKEVEKEKALREKRIADARKELLKRKKHKR